MKLYHSTFKSNTKSILENGFEKSHFTTNKLRALLMSIANYYNERPQLFSIELEDEDWRGFFNNKNVRVSHIVGCEDGSAYDIVYVPKNRKITIEDYTEEEITKAKELLVAKQF